MNTLNRNSLSDLSETVQRPAHTPEHELGIVHIGSGNFHRAHQAFLLDALRNTGDTRWGLRTVGILPGDAPTLEALNRQGGLYTVRERSRDGDTYRVVGSISEVNRPGDTEQILDWLSDPKTRIVTLTVTEGGYFVNPSTGSFDASHPEIDEEWSSDTPRGTFGYLVRALARRRAAGVEPFTLLSCDNLLGNGVAARNALVGFARATDTQLADWIAAEVATPSSMVDGITPSTTPEDRAAISEVLGIRDDASVSCEPFRQWVIEDHFPTGRPDWERVGAQLVDDVTPFEHMKLRMLNAGHQVLAHLGQLAGFKYIHDACTDDVIGGFLEHFWQTEAQPACPQPPGVDLNEYRRVLRTRFSNPGIADTVQRNTEQTSDRIVGFLLPTVADNLASGGRIAAGAFVVAAWAKRLQGKDEQGIDLTIVDARYDELVALAHQNPALPLELLDHPQLASVATSSRFREAFASAYQAISTDGVKAAARRVMAEGSAL